MRRIKEYCPVCGKEVSDGQKYCSKACRKIFEFSWDLVFEDEEIQRELEILAEEEMKSKCF